jgi:flagellar P-ring protein precursor FlgI
MNKIIFLILSLTSQISFGAKIKDIAHFDSYGYGGVIGYGIVSGLTGTGDKSMTVTQKALSNMFLNFGITITPEQMKTRNVASVMITAKIPQFPYPGQKIDIEISSIGDAISIDGGTLLRAPLYDKNGNVIAIAQGMVKTGKKRTTAIISSGGEIVSDFYSKVVKNNGIFRILLNNPDFKTAVEMENLIDKNFSNVKAKAIDSSLVEVSYSTTDVYISKLATEIGDINVNVDVRAKLIINSLSGDVVLNGRVEVLPCSLTIGDIELEVGKNQDDVGTNYISIKNNSVTDLLKALSMAKLKPHQIVEIIKTLNAAGLILGEVEII